MLWRFDMYLSVEQWTMCFPRGAYQRTHWSFRGCCCFV